MPHIMYEDLVRRALLEDLGRAGDLTSDAIIPQDKQAAMALVARQPGIVAGLDVAALAFRLIDPAVTFDRECADGSEISAGQTLARIRGGARALLTAERTALNFLI